LCGVMSGKSQVTLRLVGIVFLLLGSPLLAADITPQTLRGLMLQGDVAAVDAALEQALADVRSGRLTFDEQRELVAVFRTTNPEYRDFIDAWLREYPQSIHARIAKVMNLRHLGWIARGTSVARHTYAAAMAEMREILDAGYPVAWEVFAEHPDYIPASDAVLEYYRTHPGERPLDETLATIMAVTPSRASLDRAITAVSPQWGGSVEDMAEMCVAYGDKVADSPGYSSEMCLVDAIYSHFIKGAPLDWARATLAGLPADALPYPRLLEAVFYKPVGKDQTEQVLDWYARSPQAGSNVDQNIEYYLGLSGFAEEQAERRVGELRDKLADDSLNPELLLPIAQYELQHITGPEESVPARERLVQSLLLGKYDPEIWRALADADRTYQDPSKILARLEPYTRAVLYSNYESEHLIAYAVFVMVWRTNLSNGFANYLLDGTISETALRAIADRIDCEVVRAAKLIEWSCGNDPNAAANCAPDAYPYLELRSLLDAPEDAAICPVFQKAEVSDLAFADQ
jgi:hypothetical protein